MMFDGAGFQHTASSTTTVAPTTMTSRVQEEFEEVDDNGYLVLNSSQDPLPPPPALPPTPAPRATRPAAPSETGTSNQNRVTPPIILPSAVRRPLPPPPPPVARVRNELKATISSPDLLELSSPLGTPQHQPAEWDSLRGYQWYSPIKRQEAEGRLMAGTVVLYTFNLF